MATDELPPLPSPPLLSSSPLFRSSPLNTARGSGERSKLPQWGLGLWPTNDLVHIGVKSAALVEAVFVDFPKNKCNFP